MVFTRNISQKSVSISKCGVGNKTTYLTVICIMVLFDCSKHQMKCFFFFLRKGISLGYIQTVIC